MFYINPTATDHQFSNGCHAPPWQQVHGDISYLDVKPFDTDKLTITANTAGYFLNKGLTQEGEVNYEREGDVYPTLVALLKAKSSQFASAIENKVSHDKDKIKCTSPTRDRSCVNVQIQFGNVGF